VGRADLGLGDRLRGACRRAEARLCLRARAELLGDVLGVALGEHPALERAARSPTASRAGGAPRAARRAAEEPPSRPDAALERVLAPLAEQLLDPPAPLAARSAASRTLATSSPRSASLAAAPRASARVPRRAPPDAPQARADGSSPSSPAPPPRRGARAARSRSSAAASSPLGDEGLGADAQPLVGGADGGEPSPLPVRSRSRVGEALLDLGAPLGDLGSSASTLRRDSRALAAALGAGELGGVAVKLAGEQRRAQLGGLALEPGVDVGRLGLALERAQRLRASRSTSRARSRLSCVRSSLSCARRRRLRCLPSPAASSTSSGARAAWSGRSPPPGPG
jgi:hypothetical protein